MKVWCHADRVRDGGDAAREVLIEVGAAAELVAAGALDVAGAVVVLDELDDEQPAAVRAATAAVSPTKPTRRKPRNVRSPCDWEDRPPLVLIPSPIPISPSL